MTEDQAREVVWLTARDAAAGGGVAAWSADDRAWATRQALATLGNEPTAEAFVLARTALALTRLLPRDEAGRRFLARRLWHPAWLLLALAAGALAGLVVDQLGPPAHVNLLAPAVWAVVAWNLAVYGLALWPARGRSRPGAMSALSAWVGGLAERAHGPAQGWLRHAAPLTRQRLLLLMHTAAAALALGLVAGLYLRGLVLDYRIGWQSTFLDAGAVQALLSTLLAPASALSGIAVADVAPLRLAPGAAATAGAAPWIHLYAATLVLFVVLPRLALAALAARHARRLANDFPLPLDLPALRSLHPLMRPEAAGPLRLLWVAPAGLAPCRLLGTAVHEPAAPLRLWASDEGDAVELLPLPPALATLPAPRATGWQRLWRRADPQQVQRLALVRSADAVLCVSAPGGTAPEWLAALGRPMLPLADAAQAAAPQLPLRALADGWLADGALWQALRAALPDDERVPRLQQAWQAAQAQRLQQSMAQLAACLARAATARVALDDTGLLARRDDGSAARQALVERFSADLADTLHRLAADLGPGAPAPSPQAPTVQPTVHGRVAEGRAAVLGGLATGALAGLKADLLSGGLTMGAGAVAGGVIGALGAAGAARGLNAARGTDHSHAAWGDDALPALAQALLQPWLQIAHALPADAARSRLEPALAALQPALLAAWQRRPDAAAVAAQAAPVLQQVVQHALGGP